MIIVVPHVKERGINIDHVGTPDKGGAGKNENTGLSVLGVGISNMDGGIIRYEDLGTVQRMIIPQDRIQDLHR